MLQCDYNLKILFLSSKLNAPVEHLLIKNLLNAFSQSYREYIS